MALTKLTSDLNNITNLSDLPNTIDGLTSAQLKEKFDAAGNEIKNYINNTLIKELDNNNVSMEEIDEKLQPYIKTTDSRLSDSRKNNNQFDDYKEARKNLKIIAVQNNLPSSVDEDAFYLVWK